MTTTRRHITHCGCRTSQGKDSTEVVVLSRTSKEIFPLIRNSIGLDLLAYVISAMKAGEFLALTPLHSLAEEVVRAPCYAEALREHVPAADHAPDQTGGKNGARTEISPGAVLVANSFGIS